MELIIGLGIIWFASIGFSSKYRELYNDEKEKHIELKEASSEKIAFYEQELNKWYGIAKDMGYED